MFESSLPPKLLTALILTLYDCPLVSPEIVTGEVGGVVPEVASAHADHDEPPSVDTEYSYLVIERPPLNTGASKDIESSPFPGDDAVMVGALGFVPPPK
jgi:hypothetical protein